MKWLEGPSEYRSRTGRGALPLAIAVLASIGACSGTTTPLTDLAGGDTLQPFPIDMGGSGPAAPSTYKELPLRLSAEPPGPDVVPVEGRIGVVCIGMSNAHQECEAFMSRFSTEWSGEVDPAVTVVNCARGGHAIERWIDPAFDDALWIRCRQRLASAGLSVEQVQVVLHKAANQFTVADDGSPLPPYPDPASDFFAFQGNLDRFAERVPAELPGVRAVYTTSRSYGGFAERRQRGEPLSYEEGHALNGWLAENDSMAGVWYGWGPYIWAPRCGDGRNGSGICYERRDFEADGIHPSAMGESKIAGLWHERLLEESWYRR